MADTEIEVDDLDSPITIEIEDILDKAEAEAEKIQTAAPTPLPSAVEDAAARLQKALDAEKSARQAAESNAASERAARMRAEERANTQADEAKRYQEQSSSHELNFVNSGIESAKSILAASQREFERAMEAGEFAKAAAANAQIGTATAQLHHLETTKGTIESRQKNPPQTGAIESSSAFDNFVNSLSPRSQAWMRAHPECAPVELGGSQQKHDQMLAGHYKARAQGIPVDSDDYFRAIDESTGYRQPPEPLTPVSAASKIVPAEEAEQPRRPPTPSAPPSRDPPSSPGRTVRSVTLTTAQREAARFSRPDLTQKGPEGIKQAERLYAIELMKVKNENRANLDKETAMRMKIDAY